MSDRGIPKTFRHMHGFSSHTYSFINEAGERFWCKMHFRTQQGIENLTDDEAAQVIAEDRESSGRDLYEAIERGDFPKWTMYVQIMPEEDAKTYRFHPFDLTKVWSKKDYPLIEVGEFELNRNADNFFADIEQAAFAPTCPVHTFHRDGQMRVDGNKGSETHYEPNSYGAMQEQPSYAEPASDMAKYQEMAHVADHWDYRADDDNYYEQPGNLFRLMSPEQQHALFANTAAAIKGATAQTIERHIENCTKADPAYGEGVRKACIAKGALEV